MNQRSCDRRVDAARKSTDHTTIAHRRADFRYLIVDECASSPGPFGFARAENKIRDDLATTWCVRNLGMKLNAEYRLRFMAEGGKRIRCARCSANVSRRRRL